MPTTKSFSLYLAKPAVTKADELLTDKARGLLKTNIAHRATSSKFGDGAVLYTFPGFTDPPKWVGTLKEHFAVPDNLDSKSPCAILTFAYAKRLFAVGFSFGHVYLDDSKTEADFGLRVSINALSDGKLKSVERANIGAAIRDFAQAASQRDLRNFGFDDALDLIRKVSGRTSNDDFADIVTGARSLRFTKQMELSEVPEIARTALNLFGSHAYEDTAFKIIDFLSPILDKALQETLDEKLVESIIDGSDEFEVTLPEITSTDIGTYRFEHAGFSDFHADLSMELYRDCLGEELAKLTVDHLKHHRVTGHATNDDRLIAQWSVHAALVGSLVYDGERYALNEGAWYSLDSAYKKAADDKFIELRQGPDEKLPAMRKILSPKEKGKKVKVGYQSEQSYNADAAMASGYLLMDMELIRIDEIPGQGVEACDLLDIPGRRFIHVKKSSRQSSVLSHFFKQGGTSAQMLRKFTPFRTALIAKVRELHGKKAAADLKGAIDEKWTVEFQIADFPRKGGDFNIPFFSKLSLKDEARSLEAMNFNVAVRFIRLADAA